MAAWTVKRGGLPSYASQIKLTIDRYEELLRAERVVLAGDFNASAQTAKSQEHKQNVTRLESLNVRSAFHHYRELAHGDEQQMTLRWIGRDYEPSGYHCDFVFLSADLQTRLVGVEVGAKASWVDSKRSNHCPVVVELELDSDRMRTTL